MALFLYKNPEEGLDLEQAVRSSGGEGLAEMVQRYFDNPNCRDSRNIQIKLFQKGIELRPEGVTLLVEGEEVFLRVFDGVVDSILVKRDRGFGDALITKDFDGHWYARAESEDVPVIKVLDGTLVFGDVETEEDLVELEVLDVLENINPEDDLLHQFYHGNKQLARQELAELDLRIREDRQQLIVGPKFIHRFDLDALKDCPIQSVMIQSNPLLHLTRASDNRFYDKRDVSRGPVKSIEGTEAKFWVEKGREVRVAQPQNIGELLRQASFNDEAEGAVQAEIFRRAAYQLSKRGITFDVNGVVIETSCTEALDLDDFSGVDGILLRREGQHPLQLQRGADDLWYALGEDRPIESLVQGQLRYIKLPPHPSGISNDVSRPQASLVDDIQQLRHDPAENLLQHLANRGLIFDETHEYITVQHWSRRLTMDTFANEAFFFLYLRPTDSEIDAEFMSPHVKIVKHSDGMFYVEGKESDGPVEAVEKGMITFAKKSEGSVPQPVVAENYAGTDTETLLVTELREEVAGRDARQAELKKRGVNPLPEETHQRKQKGLRDFIGKKVGKVLNWLKSAA